MAVSMSRRALGDFVIFNLFSDGIERFF